MRPFDPFSSPLVKRSWHKKIRLRDVPSWAQKSLAGTGKCCFFMGWNNAKERPHGKVRVNGKSWYLHRYIFSKYHGVELTRRDSVSQKCDRSLCFNPMHTVRRS